MAVIWIPVLFIVYYSNSSTERIFSTSNNCKTDLRNYMSLGTIAATLFRKEGIPRNKGPTL